jgi:hypothetical protein
MRNALEKRVSGLERRVTVTRGKAAVCNCRIETRFHSADCLEAILKNVYRNCPVHGFRTLGTFFQTSHSMPLVGEDNQACPCPPHPWRSFLLSRSPDPWKDREAAEKASEQISPYPTYDLQEDLRRLNAIFAAYRLARQEWVAQAGRALPSQNEISRLIWKRARQAR